MKLQLKSDIALEEDPQGTKSLTSPTGRFSLTAFPSFIDRTIRHLGEGIDEEFLVDQIEGRDLTCLFYFLELLKRYALLIYKTDYVAVIPFNAQFRVEETFSEGKYQLSRFAFCRLENKEMVLETPLSPVRVVLQGKEGMELFYTLKEPLSFSELKERFPTFSSQELRETFALLVSANILTSMEESATSSQWEFHDLLFHSRSRQGRLDSPYGGTYRFKGKIPPLPAVKQYPAHKKIVLPVPKVQSEPAFDTIMQKRKSKRQHGTNPVTLEQLGEFMYRTSRVKEVRHMDEQEYTSRPYPGGGARYELELYPVIQVCEGIDSGVYHYDPLEHALSELSKLDGDAEDLLKGAMRSSGKEEGPQVLFVISARFQRVSWKYQSMAYAVILKNVGVLYQTMYLTATAMGLAPCALGGGDSDLFSKVIGSDYLEETSVGEFMLGSLQSF